MQLIVARPVFPTSRKAAFRRPIDCSLTLSPRRLRDPHLAGEMLSTILIFFAIAFTGGPPMIELAARDSLNGRAPKV